MEELNKENHISNNTKYLLKQLKNLSPGKSDDFITGEKIRGKFSICELDSEVVIFKTINGIYWIKSLELKQFLYSIKDYDISKAKNLVVNYLSVIKGEEEFYEVHYQYEIK